MMLVSSFFTCAGKIALVSAYLLSRSCVFVSQSGWDTFFYVPIKF